MSKGIDSKQTSDSHIQHYENQFSSLASKLIAEDDGFLTVTALSG